MRWVMQAAKTLTTTQRTRRRPIHFLITTITFGMNAMVEGRPRQLKMPRLDAYHGAVLSAAESYEPATVDVAPAVTRVRSSDAQAVLIFGTGPAAAKFVVEYRKAGGGGLLIANSSTSPEVMARLAGNTMARGVGLVQVVPAVTKTTIPVVKEYHDTLARYGKPDWKPSAYGLEGFLAAKLLVEGLRRAGPSPTRESLSAALDRIEQFDAGGITLDYKSGRREGLRSVDIGILGAEGRLMN